MPSFQKFVLQEIFVEFSFVILALNRENEF